jgi:hypothetical protein
MFSSEWGRDGGDDRRVGSQADSELQKIGGVCNGVRSASTRQRSTIALIADSCTTLRAWKLEPV